MDNLSEVIKGNYKAPDSVRVLLWQAFWKRLTALSVSWSRYRVGLALRCDGFAIAQTRKGKAEK